MIKGVITGDIIHSTRLPAESKVKLFESLGKYLKSLKKNLNFKYEMYRGDSFQCLVNKPENTLRLALLIKTYIRSLNPSEIYDLSKKNDTTKKRNTILTTYIVDARIAIGIGQVELEARKLANSDGAAFILSGHLLDEIKDKRQHLAIESEDKFNDEWQIEALLLDAIIRKTTAFQCQVLNYKLLDYTEMEIANELNIGQSAVNQRSTSGDWKAIDEMVFRFESVYKKNNNG